MIMMISDGIFRERTEKMKSRKSFFENIGQELISQGIVVKIRDVADTFPGLSVALGGYLISRRKEKKVLDILDVILGNEGRK